MLITTSELMTTHRMGTPELSGYICFLLVSSSLTRQWLYHFGSELSSHTKFHLALIYENILLREVWEDYAWQFWKKSSEVKKNSLWKFKGLEITVKPKLRSWASTDGEACCKPGEAQILGSRKWWDTHQLWWFCLHNLREIFQAWLPCSHGT